ncbi:class IIb bacteriocin, lactobin A/cerein 7B family [Pseudoxanthomonas putridarboris]|uniref:Class IIb bacteriocin, lactobin A/cerein 7B family n=1 Tax=Pseudoxanthomonas putridarboris TaxID=752605 RepID=A0ABU9J2Q7_9GAMM
MRNLAVAEIEQVEGGIIPVLIVVAAAALLGGCATTPERNEEDRSEVVGDE